MLTVYGRATSSNVQAVMWMIGELGLAHKRIDKGHVYGGLDAPDFRALNPHGMIPVLQDGNLTMFESNAINRYLAARYGAGWLWPIDQADRARADMWSEWGKTTLAPAFTHNIFWPRVRTAAKDRDEAALAAAITRFDGLLETLAEQLSGRHFVIGTQLSVADITIGHLLYRYFDIDIPRRAPAAVEVYYKRLAQRASYQRHVMVSYDALRAEGS